MSVTLDHVSSRSLAEVIGANCKRIRTDIGVTQDVLAHYARIAGLRWNAAKVGDFEAGRSSPPFSTVLAVTLALDMAWQDEETPGGVTLADLLKRLGASDTEMIALTERLSVPAALVADVCRGKNFLPAGHTIVNADTHAPLEQRGAITIAQFPRDAGPTEWVEDKDPFVREVRAEFDRMEQVIQVMDRLGLAESRLAKQLGVTPAQLTEASARLWQRTFSEERDRRAGPNANQQKRGRISRELRTELEKALDDKQEHDRFWRELRGTIKKALADGNDQ